MRYKIEKIAKRNNADDGNIMQMQRKNSID